MPIRPKRQCNKVGCPELTSKSYCSVHEAEMKAKATTIKYQRRREKAIQSSYETRQTKPLYNHKWNVYSGKRLKEYPMCVSCGGQASVTDHIVPHKGDEKLFWNPNNHQSMCKSCHNRKTAREDGGFGNPVQ